MGICDCKSKNENINQTTQKSNSEFRQTIKYFPKSRNSSKIDTLILNNDVIVSDLGTNIENKYEKLKKLGEGAYGEVWKVRHKVLGKEFAMKIIEKSPYCVSKEINNEINILKKLDHPNILKILEFHSTEDKFYIITDFCPEGELYNEISNKKEFSESEAAFIIYQILSAIRYCHKMRVIHRDIKPENIMIMGRESNGGLIVKLIDFGTARIFSEGNVQKGLVGSSYYIAPEVIDGKYDESCDLWSIGVIMYIMLTGYPPFNGEDDDSILRAVKTGKYDTTLDTYQKLSSNAKDLISKLLKYNPHERITARDALNHPWFKTSELSANYHNSNSLDPNEVRDMLRNLENYKNDNMLKCAAIAYLVHQNTNIKQCRDATKLFFSIDLNHDGKLEKNELEYAYKKYCGLSDGDARQKAKLIFINIDTDNNGFIENEEFIRACINPRLFNSYNYLKFAFDYFDNDNSGYISIQEIEKKFLQSSKNKSDTTKRELKKLFDKIDINKDGQISFEEFSSMIKDIINT
jgi:calcium-dependent protein kinase